MAKIELGKGVGEDAWEVAWNIIPDRTDLLPAERIVNDFARAILAAGVRHLLSAADLVERITSARRWDDSGKQ